MVPLETPRGFQVDPVFVRGNAEPDANWEDTQVDNLCYERRDAD